MKRMAYGIVVTLLVATMLASTFTVQLAESESSTIIVPDDYSTIQEAINNADEGDTILVSDGIYVEHVVVNKSVSLIGENAATTIIDGNGTGTVIAAELNVTTIIHVVADNVNLSRFTVRNGGFLGVTLNRTTGCTVSNITSVNSSGCLFLYNSNNNYIAGSVFVNGTWGVMLFNSTENKLVRNVVSENLRTGIAFGGPRGSGRNLIANNTVSHNGWVGFEIPASSDNRIINNNISYNSLGILLEYSHNQIVGNLISNNRHSGIQIILGARNNTITGNTIQGSGRFGLSMVYGKYNRIYHNNFIDNTGPRQVYSGNLASYGNVWSNGVEGNYWSDYAGQDNDNDGIGDTSYMFYEYGQASDPLMGRFHGFNTSPNCYVNVISNSTIEEFAYFESNSTIRIHVSNATVDQAFGFCRVSIPHKLLTSSGIAVIMDDGATQVLHPNFTLYDNGSHKWIYFAYEHSTHEVNIVFSHWNPLDIFYDLKINIKDVAVAALAFRSSPGHPRWNKLCDVNDDDVVDLIDLILIAKSFGKVY